MEDTEIWRDVFFVEKGVTYDYRGLYQVSNFGMIKSLNYNRTGKEKILKPGMDKKGYFFVILYKNGKCKRFSIHRLVGHMFIENDNSLENTLINHKDENKTNNHVSNLEWCSSKYNVNYGTRNKRVSEAHEKKPIVGVHTKTGEIIQFISTREAQRHGFNSGAVSQCCQGKTKSHKGYKWYYKEDYMKLFGEP